LCLKRPKNTSVSIEALIPLLTNAVANTTQVGYDGMTSFNTDRSNSFDIASLPADSPPRSSYRSTTPPKSPPANLRTSTSKRPVRITRLPSQVARQLETRPPCPWRVKGRQSGPAYGSPNGTQSEAAILYDDIVARRHSKSLQSLSRM
jgi:hypothetical protein